MPTTEENIRFWDSRYHWNRGGEEWSEAWGDADMQWHAVILPRIHAFVPTGTILELGPGFGRWTDHLKDLCGRLIAVDLSGRCVEACGRRFASHPHVEVHLNDGRSLGMVPDGSVDFVFSFDSLVHAEEDVIRAYLHELSRKLKREGVGFVHHSNAGEVAGRGWPGGKLLRGLNPVGRVDPWRAQSMTAPRFECLARESGLQCVGQELIDWPTHPGRHIDCISVFARPDSRWARPNRVIRNGAFAREAAYTAGLSRLYASRSFGPGRPSSPAGKNRVARLAYERLKAAVPARIKQRAKDGLRRLRGRGR